MADLIIRPSGDNTVAFSPKTGGSNYLMVDEVSADDNTTYVYGESGSDLYDLDDHSSESGTISNVRVTVRAKNYNAISATMNIKIKIGGTEYQDASADTLTGTWTTFYHDWAQNPNTSSAWTWTNIDDLLAGFAITGLFGDSYVTQVFVTVTYSETTSDDSTPAYTRGSDSGDDSQAAFLEGTTTYIRDLEVQVVDSLDNDVVDNLSNYVVVTRKFYCHQQVAYLEGEAGGTPADDSIPAYLTGTGGAIDNHAAYLEGAPSRSSASAYLVGGIETDDNQAAYMEGEGIAVTSDISAYLMGYPRSSVSAFTQGAIGTFSKYKTYTIPEPDETITDFILMLTVLSSNDLRTVSNGGYVQNTVSNGGVGRNITVPCDMVFADDKFNETVFDFEWEWYDPTTGGFTAHIRIPTLSTGDDRVIYVTFGDDSIDDTQENITEVWGTDYKMVLHLAEASGNRLDSTIYGRDASPVNSPGRTDGNIIIPPSKWAVEFDPADSDEALEVPWDEELSNMDDGWTCEIWLKTQDTTPSEIAYAIGMGDYTDGWICWLATYSKIQAYFNAKGCTSYYTQTSGKNLWGIVWDEPNNYWRLYRDVLQTASYYNPGVPTIDEGQPLVIGGNPEDTDSNSWYGWVDEVRWYRGVRTAAWFKATHGTCNSPATLSSTEDVVQTSSTPAFLEGYTAGVSSKPAYLEGVGLPSSSQSAYLNGGIAASDSQSAYLTGPNVESSSISAYLAGPLSSDSSVSAYLEGNPPPTTSSVSAFLWADWPPDPNVAESSMHGYLEGDGTFPFSDDYTGTNEDDWNEVKWQTGFGA